MKLRLSMITAILLMTGFILSACGGGTKTTGSTLTPTANPGLPSMTTYANDHYGYSIDYPADWQATETVPQQFRAYAPGVVSGNSEFGNNEAGIVVTIDDTKYPQAVSDETYYNNFLASANQDTSILKLDQQGTGPANFGQNISGYKSTWTVTDSVGPWELQWFFASANGVHFVVCTYSLKGAFNAYDGIFKAAIDNFKFIQVTATPTPTPTDQSPSAGKYSSPPPMTIDASRQYTVTMTTDYGNIVLQLFPADAPQTVNSFVFLIREKFYDGTVFHRVIPTFVAQGGDPTGTGRGGPGYYIPDEISSRKNVTGALSMANAGPNTNGSQFFICLTDQPSLDGHYTVFGQVVQGIDVVNKIKQGDKLITVTVEEK